MTHVDTMNNLLEFAIASGMTEVTISLEQVVGSWVANIVSKGFDSRYQLIGKKWYHISTKAID